MKIIRWMFLLASLFAFSHGIASTYYVSPSGSDASPGTMEAPFANLPRALEATRQARRDAPGQPATLLLQSGTYLLERPLVLYGVDSDLVIEAVPGGAATLVGGRPITGWKKTGNGGWSADLSSWRMAPALLHMLVVNGRVRPRARLPREGTFEHETYFTAKWLSSTGGEWGANAPTQEQMLTMVCREGDLPANLVAENVEVRVYHMWDESLVPVASHDPKTRRLTFGVPCGQPPGSFDVRKYVVFNVKEGMHSPGQWYHDRKANRLVYWPLPGEDMTHVEVFAPAVENIIRMDGDPQMPVARVTLKRLLLAVTNTPLKLEGFGAMNMPGAIEMVRVKDCLVSAVTIMNAAGYAVQARWAEGLRLEDCDFRDLGAGAVRTADSTAVAVEGCLLERNGFLYPCGIALWTSSGKGVTVRHNTIRDATYNGICNQANDALFEGNLIERVMLEMHDGAAIYTGFCKGVTLRGNVVRDIVDTGGYGASSYYIDETGEDHLIENNLSVNVVRPSHNHMAKNNTIRRNVFISSGELRLHFPRSTGSTVEENVLVGREGIQIQVAPDGFRSFRDNRFAPGTGRIVRDWLNEYNPSGREDLKMEDGNRIDDPGLFVTGGQGTPSNVEFLSGIFFRKMNIDMEAFKRAGCGR